MAKTKTAETPLLSVKISADLKTVTYAVRGYDPLVLLTSNLSSDAIENCKALAIANKIRDTIANFKSDTHTDADRYAVIQEAVAHFNGGGDWTKAERQAGNGAETLIVLALARVYPVKLPDGTIDFPASLKKANQTIDDYATKKGFTRKVSAETWGNTRQVAAEILVIKAERAKLAADKAGLDSDSLFEELKNS